MSAKNPLDISGPNHSSNHVQPNTAKPVNPANQPQITDTPF